MNVLDNLFSIFSTEKYILIFLNGMRLTLIISVGASVLGMVLGILVALCKLSPKSNRLMTVPRVICDIYTTIIRGTPMALQLFIMAFVIFTFRGFPLEVTAILAFGINSGAYVAENIRAGILSVDIGQTEAGLSLGLSRSKTMSKIIIPQAIKNVIPAIGNELIALVKETSIVSMIGMQDLTAAAKNVGSGQNLASYFVPMLVAAGFYLIIVYSLTFAVKIIEKRLRASDRH